MCIGMMSLSRSILKTTNAFIKIKNIKSFSIVSRDIQTFFGLYIRSTLNTR